MTPEHQKKNFAADVFRIARFFVFAVLAIATLATGYSDADAATRRKAKTSKPAENKLYSAIVVDTQTGAVLTEKSADSIRHPASLTKIMTLYMTFEAIDRGTLSLSDRIAVSDHASSMSPSKLGLRPGQSIRVEDAIKAVVTKSANDIAVALAERLGGSERMFAASMTRKARALGMSRTTFRNASGLPDPQQVTTARDMAKLAMAMLRDFPHRYHYFGIRNFEYNGSVMTNHNRLLGQYPGLDGIKTGYINASGFNLVASAKQNGRRLVGVVFGGQSWRSRNDRMVKLLDDGFSMVANRNMPRIQEASLESDTDTADARDAMDVPPVPYRRPDIAADDNTTDEAEDAAYAPATSQQITSMIDAAQTQQTQTARPVATPAPYTPPAATDPFSQQPLTGTVAPQTQTAYTQDDAAAVQQMVAPASQPPATNTSRPANNTVAARHAPVPTSKHVSKPEPTTTTAAGKPSKTDADDAYRPTGNTRTVMQLRIPRSQLPVGVAPSQIASAGNSSRGWSIQVGAFPSRAMTDQALRTAQSRLPSHLRQGQPVIIPQSSGGGIIFRARLQGYNELQANAACASLGSCIVVSPGS